MVRRLVLFAFVLALCGQAVLTGRAWASVMGQVGGASLARHLVMHAQHEAHDHHEPGEAPHRGHAAHAAHHVAGDGCSTPLALASLPPLPQAWPLDHSMPRPPSLRPHRPPFLEGLMRPPARATV